MNDKFTIRDFFVYFLSGVAIILFISISNYDAFSKALLNKKETIKDFSTIIIFFSIPIAYFVGHILQGIDTVFYLIATASRNINIKSHKWYNLLFLFVYILNNHRISGRLFLNGNNLEKFWHDCVDLQVEKKFSACEYWYVMNDLFKGLFLGSTIFMIISLTTKDWLLAFVYALLMIIFWFRAVFFANSFIKTVRRTKKYSH